MTEEFMTTESSTTDSIRKAAILVSTLNRDSADALLDKMEVEQAARVRNAVFELETISDEEQDQIVREFVSAGGGAFGTMSNVNAGESEDRHVDAKPFQLREYGEASAHESTPQSGDRSRPIQWREDQSTKALVDSDQSKGHDPLSDNCPFPILREASAETLANHLVNENAQVIAVLVAHLPPKRAAELIARLAPKQQADVLRRVAGLDAAAPAAIEVLQRQLEDKLTEEIRAQRNRDAGLVAVNLILNAAGSKRHELLSNLTEIDNKLSQQVAKAQVERPPSKERSEARPADVHEKPTAEDVSVTRRAASHSTPHGPATELNDDGPNTAAGDDDQTIQIRSKMDSETESITFEQLAELDDEGLAILFREVDPEVTLVALAGASSDFVARVMQPLPPREARTLRRRLERLGPIRLSDISAAQREVAQAATRLVRDGRLPRFVTPRFAVAA